MTTSTYGMIEIVAFFGAAFGFSLWQLRAVRRQILADRARAAGETVPETAPGREDVFWREMTRPSGGRTAA